MDERVDIVGAAEAALGRSLGEAHPERLHGGYSWQTYVVSSGAGPQAVVRVAPRGGTLDPYDPDGERRALEAACGAVPAPEVLLVEPDPAPYGAPLQVQTVAPGAALRSSTIESFDERRSYRSAMATALGELHRDGDPARLSTVRTTGEALRWVIDQEVDHYVRSAPARNPGFEIGLRWLLTNLPPGNDAPVVCHGDFRLNNVLWKEPGRIGAVLDWERAWAGDPLCDIAFSRQFSGWGAVDRDAVALYEAASGRTVDESRMTFYLRLERWRSYTASMRGLAAVASSRSDRPELLAIGEAGVAGMWDLINWLEDGLVALPARLSERPGEYVGSLSEDRRGDMLVGLGAADPLRAHLVDEQAKAGALATSVATLRTVTGFPALTKALRIADPQGAWERAFEVLTIEATDGGRTLHAALQALGLRFTARPTFLPEMKWR